MQMKISERTIKALQEAINGEIEHSFYRSGPKLIDLFNEFGRNDIYGQGFPSRASYTRDCLRSFNNTYTLKKIIEAAFDPRDYLAPTSPELSLEKTVAHLNKFLAFDNYILMKEDKKGTYEVFQTSGNTIPEMPIKKPTIVIKNESMLSLAFVDEQTTKANKRLAQNDYDGAITIAYTLIESMIKELLKESKVEFKETKGDIRSLYGQLSESLNLSPKGENIESHIKPILEGFRQQVSGFYSLANKASDRHTKKYTPERRHARLVVHAALIFCEFLLDSYEYQQGKKKP